MRSSKRINADPAMANLRDTGELVISPLTAEDIPSEAEDLHAELERMLPNVPIASLLVEMDRHTGFLDCFVHADGKQARSPQLKRNLIACLIGLSTNLGLHGMAASCGIPYDVLAWTAEWYIREANICLVNYHHQLPVTAMFGSGTLSSSDGQRFPTAGPLLTKKANLDLVADHWDGLLRLAGSLKYGHATASLIVGKLSASSRQNALAAALKEYGAIRRTIYAAKYLSDESYRRKITRRRPEQQNEQAWCLTVVTNAVVNYYGSITVDYERELAQLDDQGHRPLRTAGMDEPGAGLQQPDTGPAVRCAPRMHQTMPTTGSGPARWLVQSAWFTVASLAVGAESGSTQEPMGQRDLGKAARSAEPRVMNATRMMGSMQTVCITAYHGGQTPGIRSTPMIAIGMMTARALTRSKVLRDPREAETVIR
ncbi:Tn3 family transposase [Streptomyces olivoreticuli]